MKKLLLWLVLLTTFNAEAQLIGGVRRGKPSSGGGGGSGDATLAGAQTFTGAKTFSAVANFTAIPTILGVQIPSLTSTGTFTGKTISGSNNTLLNIPQSSIVNLTSDLAALTGNFVSYPFTYTTSSYIVRATGLTATASEYRRTSPIEISSIGNPIKVSIGNFGGSIAPIAYYNSSTISSGTYLGSEITPVGGTFPSTSSQITDYVLTVPAGATHVVFTSHNSYPITITGRQQVGNTDINNLYSNQGFLSATGVYAKYANPYISILNSENENIFQRFAKSTGVPSDALPLIVVAGQSNSDGRAPQSSAPQWLIDMGYKIDNYMVWNRTTGVFQSYQLGVNTGSFNNTSTTFGYDIFFAKAWLDANPGKKLYCIKQTAGGVPITEKGSNTGNNNYRWQPKTELITPGQLSMMDELQIKVNNVKSYAATNKLKFSPLAILYHQGEGDGDRAANGGVSDYQVNLSNLIGGLRGLFQSPNLPVINGTINATFSANYPLINAVFTSLNNLDPYFRTVDMSSHQTTIGDNLHYDTSALAYMGSEMYSKLTSNSTITTPTSYLLNASLSGSLSVSGSTSLPTSTTIGTVTPFEIGNLSGTTSSIQSQINSKQSTLTSGVSIKTINGNTLLGSGDIALITNNGTATLTNKTIDFAAGVNTVSNIPVSAIRTADLQVFDPTIYALKTRVGTTASSATPTIDASLYDQYNITALAANATFAAPTGTLTDGQSLLIRVKDNATPRTLAWNAAFRAGSDIALPTTTVSSKTMYIQFVYNAADTKWDLVGTSSGF